MHFTVQSRQLQCDNNNQILLKTYMHSIPHLNYYIITQGSHLALHLFTSNPIYTLNIAQGFHLIRL